MLETLFVAAADADFSAILDTLELARRLRDWLKRSPAKLTYQHSRPRGYAAFAHQISELATSPCNRSFLIIEAVSESEQMLMRHLQIRPPTVSHKIWPALIE